jgi:hypothetical protein
MSGRSVRSKKVAQGPLANFQKTNRYPGPHIPSPLEIGSATGADVLDRSHEVLSLTKANWNNADGIGRYPITLTFARKVGVTMTEFGEDDEPNPLYRYYM